MPTRLCAGRSLMASPWNSTWPDWGLSRPASVLSKVDLPPPLAPMNANVCPSSTEKLTENRAWKSP